MGPIRSGDSARRKPRGKLHPGMANGKGGPPLSKKQIQIYKKEGLNVRNVKIQLNVQTAM